MAIAPSALILEGVAWLGTAEVGPFAIVGHRVRNPEGAPAPTTVGSGAIIGSHTTIYEGNTIGARFATGHGALVREHNVIGDDVSIGTGSVVEHHVRLGNGVRLHSRVFVPEYTEIHDQAWLGPNVVLTNAKYPQSPGVKAALRGAIIERGAMIGANATVLPGVRIGARALVGAGAVVTRDVPSGAVVAGNPAVIIKQLEDLPYAHDSVG